MVINAQGITHSRYGGNTDGEGSSTEQPMWGRIVPKTVPTNATVQLSAAAVVPPHALRQDRLPSMGNDKDCKRQRIGLPPLPLLVARLIAERRTQAKSEARPVPFVLRLC